MIVTDQRQLEALAPTSIGFLGGSFNPAHAGHVALATHVLEHHLAYVAFCPHSFHPEKQRLLAPIDDRLHILRLFVARSPYRKRLLVVHPSVVAGTQGAGFVALHGRLVALGCRCGLLAGADAVLRPHYPDYLCDLPHFISLRGDDHSVTKVRSRLRGPVVFCDSDHADHSSTKVRHALARGEAHDLDDELRRFLHEQRLFGCGPSAPAHTAADPARSRS